MYWDFQFGTMFVSTSRWSVDRPYCLILKWYLSVCLFAAFVFERETHKHTSKLSKLPHVKLSYLFNDALNLTRIRRMLAISVRSNLSTNTMHLNWFIVRQENFAKNCQKLDFFVCVCVSHQNSNYAIRSRNCGFSFINLWNRFIWQKKSLHVLPYFHGTKICVQEVRDQIESYMLNLSCFPCQRIDRIPPKSWPPVLK